MTQLGLGGVGPVNGALLSDDQLYRYRLWRRWGGGARVLWVMLNPSTADAAADDPTIRKCCGFAKRWGYEGIEVVNLFAFRATKPSVLALSRDPIGPHNDLYIREALLRADLVVAAWGRVVGVPRLLFLERVARVRELLPGAWCLGRCEDGQPRHPLMLAYDTPRETW